MFRQCGDSKRCRRNYKETMNQQNEIENVNCGTFKLAGWKRMYLEKFASRIGMAKDPSLFSDIFEFMDENVYNQGRIYGIKSVELEHKSVANVRSSDTSTLLYINGYNDAASDILNLKRKLIEEVK